MPQEAFSIIQMRTSGPSIGCHCQTFILPSGIDVTPTYPEKQSKSVAVSKTEAGGGASDNSMNWNEAEIQ